MLEHVYTQKRDGTGAAPSYSKIKKVLILLCYFLRSL